LFRRELNRVTAWFVLGVLGFIFLLAGLEHLGLPRQWIGLIFLLSTIALYATIGILSRTTDEAEYYVAGRRVPALYNGMATGADWMSAASFIGVAGTLYLTGYSGLAFIVGWTGGYCLVALFLAPYLRRFGQFTISDFLGERYGGRLPRLIAIGSVIFCSFTYVVAQIYGVGIVTARLTGVAFELGIFLGLGGILVCSFLGGMRAVTWTQVAQYIVLMIAYLVPVVWLSVKQTGVPLPQAVYGYQLQKVTAKEQELLVDPKEIEIRYAYAVQAELLRKKLENPAQALKDDRRSAESRIATLKASGAPVAEVLAAERALSGLPRDAKAAQRQWTAALAQAETKSLPLNGMPPHGQQFAGNPDGTLAEQAEFDLSRRNFLALVFCLMVGTAALPHILIRYYTVPTVREARRSVAWSMLFILLLYLTAPALAVLVKYEVLTQVVGTSFSQLPEWLAAWSRVDPSLLSVTDMNLDGVLQLNELTLGGDVIVLAAPAIAGLPYVISALVAAGALAAALSTADGLLLTISSAFSHDLYYKMIDPNASTARRVTISKMVLMVVALAAAYVAAQRPADILFLVSAAFSFAAAAFFPALVLGIFWKRANRLGASLGMLAGLGITIYYMAMTQPWMRGVLGITAPVQLWWGIQPISAGVFGVPLGFAVMVVVSLLSRPPSESEQAVAERVRYPT
jgi:cation/acetate symporter